MKESMAPLIEGVEATLRPLVESVSMEALASHNQGYQRYAGDPFQHLIVSERVRYERVLSHLADRPLGRAADLGCFIPYLPVALARLGHEVTAVDRFDLYSPELRSVLVELAGREGFRMLDLDILNDSLEPLGAQDMVLLMAVVEHLNGSPQALMERIRNTLGSSGLLVFEVPNIAELGRRLDLFRGRSPLPDYASYLRSSYPFLGHNREMTVAEVKTLLGETGFSIEKIDCFDYTPTARLSRRGRLVHNLKRLPAFDRCRETILALARPAGSR